MFAPVTSTEQASCCKVLSVGTVISVVLPKVTDIALLPMTSVVKAVAGLACLGLAVATLTL